ncbi:hypothetical protein HPHPM1_0192 [Helicobacter pylori Hp M1]|uniref:Uncharacterized protein n=1 Tax=Helicobacter pylori Hp H-24 TaxID=992039 RepID=J0AT33_HELPX|nr:hypothetical protein HPHPH24_0189 [Helicobacter pylori Hp H-24]EJC19500.1 hypothetical protein HPHPH24B_0087 [Helicobacter pylori Hp H-24b]EJC40369.1 hypothetical protein HPHPM1_0192 [Helicobacter pylori Hp M1]EJC43728.1 hypothetical protein HPHPM3_0194 [Helicobacter pylori Hp M3]EJC45323.1 hypothetical protein HPHPM4_0195 [Helicobacter pylori Hp M4]EJC47175.1 hypothetical protein HPHPM5_0223 [Helicobacter pylori Hp M5]EJC59244.1 hypothetical protein HPHPM9_1695 [Helicobacter pylori Hp M9]
MSFSTPLFGLLFGLSLDYVKNSQNNHTNEKNISRQIPCFIGFYLFVMFLGVKIYRNLL